MTTMTFESFNSAPRRAAVRRQVRPATRTAPTIAPPAAAPVRVRGEALRTHRRGALIALFGITALLHAAAIIVLRQPVALAAPVAKLEALSIELAPPPPPPPVVVPPKPVPQLAKAVPAPAKPTAPLPVVHSVSPPDTSGAQTVQVATTPTPPPVAAPAPPPAPVEVVSEPRGFAGYLNNPPPAYPEQAQDRGWEGQVLLKVHVLSSGRADSAVVARTSGHKILDDDAIKTVMRWSFDPAKRGRTPIDGWVNVPINYKLS